MSFSPRSTGLSGYVPVVSTQDGPRVNEPNAGLEPDKRREVVQLGSLGNQSQRHSQFETCCRHFLQNCDGSCNKSLCGNGLYLQ
jgi:hypothetical protein